MAQSPRRQQRTDARRIGDKAAGKLDRDAGADRNVAAAPERARGDGDHPSRDELRDRLGRLREDAVEALRRLGISPELDDTAPRAGTDTGLDEGDRAQASERQDASFATRERLAARITRLSAALDRMDAGTYGRCADCGGDIEPARLAALPEAETCLRCQERREQTEPDRAA